VQDSVISILETTAEDGKNYQTQYYNLDAVISVGYRVKKGVKSCFLLLNISIKQITRRDRFSEASLTQELTGLIDVFVLDVSRTK
jgi:hypothetical protein